MGDSSNQTPKVTSQLPVSARSAECKITEIIFNARDRVKNTVIRALRKHQIKIDKVIKVRMSRQDQEGEHQKVSQAFYEGLKLILREEDFDEAYEE